MAKTHLKKKDAIIAYKGFDKNLCCRGFQYEVGKTYHTRKEIGVCIWGFHACPDPADILWYYNPSQGHRFCKVKMWGWVDADMDERKLASSYIEIVEEIPLAELEVKMRGLLRAYTMPERLCRTSNSSASSKKEKAYVRNEGTASMAVAQGGGSLAETLGHYSNAITKGILSKALALGHYSLASALGTHSSAVTNGDDSCAVNMLPRSLAVCKGADSMAVCNEYASTAICDGKESFAITKGENSMSEAKGAASCAVAFGESSMVRGALGCALFLVERGEFDTENKVYPIINALAVVVDGENVKADTWYTLRNGELVEVE